MHSRFRQPPWWLLAMALVCVHVHAAEMVDIASDPRFGPEVARAGMHDPAHFQNQGIYMSAAADPSKEVVLFVHGANGSPRDLLDVAMDLDSVRQQAWFAFYATGNSIAQSGHALADDMRVTLHATGVTRVRVFAHSMGGLVAWQMINDLQPLVHVVQFISVNTPWNGDPTAQLGVWFSPRPLPIWVDLAPDSEALEAIWREKPSVPFTLVYTLESVRARGDGTVSRESEMQPQMKAQATAVVQEVGTHSTALHGETARRLVALLGDQATTPPLASAQIHPAAAR